MHSYWLAAILFSIGFCHGQTIHPNAHAHNDYEHPRPLLDALQNGFQSVEADVHLVDGELYVSHGKPKPSAAITLQSLYLDPLDSLNNRNTGINKNSDKPFLLLIDIKTDATRTLEKLITKLKNFPALFPPKTPGSIVQVVISGNRDYDVIIRTGSVFIDGRPGDLGNGYSANKMPLISDHYRNWMRWNGRGTPPKADIQRVRDLATRVHQENKLLRLWAIPDNEEAWKVLLEAGVDLINTDRLEALNAFLTKPSSRE